MIPKTLPNLIRKAALSPPRPTQPDCWTFENQSEGTHASAIHLSASPCSVAPSQKTLLESSSGHKLELGDQGCCAGLITIVGHRGPWSSSSCRSLFNSPSSSHRCHLHLPSPTGSHSPPPDEWIYLALPLYDGSAFWFPLLCIRIIT